MWLVGEGGIYGNDCTEVYRFPHTTYPYSSCIFSFLQQHPYFLFIFKCFSFLYYYTAGMVQPKICDHYSGLIIIIIIIIINRVLQYSGSKTKWVVVNE